MTMHTFRLLGGAALRTPDGDLVDGPAAQPRRIAVLAILADAHPGVITRDKVVGILWPDRPSRKARRLLTQALYELRKEIGKDALLASGDDLGLNAGHLDVDLIRFREALRQGDPEAAVRAYGGLALDGFSVANSRRFEEWAERLRNRESRAHQGALETLAEEAGREGRIGDAVRWRRRLVEERPYDARAVEGLMGVLEEAGNRAVALEAAEAYERRMRADLELEPNPRVARLAGRMRGPPDVPPDIPPEEDAGPGDTAPDAERVVPARRPGDETAGPTAFRAPPKSRKRLTVALPSTLLYVVAAVTLTAVAAYAFLGDPSGDSVPDVSPRTVAVLPFQDLDSDAAHGYFAGGLHDELITRLSKVEGLSVISRSSVAGYEGVPQPRRVAGDLGAGTVVEGSVRAEGDRLRVSVQLVDAVTGRHLWAERYDRTLDDAFAIQSDIARQVVEAVGGTLEPSEASLLAEAPTGDAEAYRLYLQGRYYHRRPGFLRGNLEIARQLYERALTRDPGFALAHAALSEVHGLMYWFRYDPSPERTALQREAAEASLRLDPDLAEGRLARGLWHYWARRDYRRALEELDAALERMPNDAWLWSWVGYVNRRLGNWGEVETAFRRAAELNPLDANLFSDLGGNMYAVMRRYEDAVAAYDRALVLAPDLHAAAVEKGWTYARWQGRTDTLHAVLERVPRDAELSWLGSATAQRALLFLWERRPDSLLAVVREASGPVLEGQTFYLPTVLIEAWAHGLRGDGEAERRAYDAARAMLDSVVVELPGDWRVRSARGLALAGLGDTSGALREADWLREAPVYDRDVLQGPLAAEERARILALAGNPEGALDEIERLLSGHSLLSVHALRLDPRWDPVRTHPGFRELLARHEDPV